MANSCDLSKYAFTDYHGLSQTIIDNHRLSETIKDSHRLEMYMVIQSFFSQLSLASQLQLAITSQLCSLLYLAISLACYLLLSCQMPYFNISICQSLPFFQDCNCQPFRLVLIWSQTDRHMDIHWYLLSCYCD